jgi:hypothetical protein
MNMSGEILGVSASMFASVATGLTLLLLTLTRTPTHRVLAWILLAGVALHGAWGVFAVFVLKS